MSSTTATYRSYLIATGIALLSFFAALVYNELNITALREAQSDKLERTYNYVRTADDAAYLRPAESFYHTGIWKDYNPGRQSYFLRTPGYGLFRLVMMDVLGYEQSYYSFKYVQVVLFTISVFFLFQTALLLGLSEWVAIVLAVLYGVSPFGSGFLYYSITEGITPALMIAYLYCLARGCKGHGVFYLLLAALIMGYIGITRPVLLLFGAALPLAVWWGLGKAAYMRRALVALLLGAMALAPISIWAYRSYQIAGQYVGVYPIYYAENNSQFRPTHAAIWEFQKSFGKGGKAFHEEMVPLWRAAAKGDTDETHIDTIMMGIPEQVVRVIGETKLREAYHRYRSSIVYQRSVYPKGVAMPDTIPAIEQQVINEFAIYTTQVNKELWLWCHVIVPLKLFKALSFHSNLSLHIFQHTYRGYFFLLLHLLCCLSFIVVLFFAEDKMIRVVSGVLVGAYFFYLCYFFRGLEERYTLPVLPLLLLGLGSFTSIIRRRA
jgi:hypothetical protein